MKILNFLKFSEKISKKKIIRFCFWFFFILIILGLVFRASEKTFGEQIWAKRELALAWSVEFEGEIRQLSSEKVGLKIKEKEISFPLSSQAIFLEQKLVKVETFPLAYNLEAQPIFPDDFASQIGKKARVLVGLINNDLQGIQVIVIAQ